MIFSSCYFLPPWWTEVHIIISGLWRNNPYICRLVHCTWMLEFHPLLQREYHDQIIICNGQPNMPHRNAHASLKVRVGTWVCRSYHGYTQRTGGLKIWMASQYHCECILHGPGRLNCDYTTCSLPTRTTGPSQSRRKWYGPVKIFSPVDSIHLVPNP